jgi:dephospho-CoA kinase
MSREFGERLDHVDEAGLGAAVDAHEESFLIGLTGPIGCGKSTVARMLGELGGMIVDADVLARRATAAGATALPQIRRRFGDGVFTAGGELDRGALAAIVFRDADALRDLERIVHPQVRLLLEEDLKKAARERVPFVVFEAIKLVEGGLAERCDEVWLVDCSPAVQRARLSERGSDAADVEWRLAAQGEGLADRLAAQVRGRARVRRLSTDGSLEDTRERVEDALADALEPLVLGDR